MVPTSLSDGQRPVENGQADDFGFGDVRAMFHALGRKNNAPS